MLNERDTIIWAYLDYNEQDLHLKLFLNFCMCNKMTLNINNIRNVIYRWTIFIAFAVYFSWQSTITHHTVAGDAKHKHAVLTGPIWLKSGDAFDRWTMFGKPSSWWREVMTQAKWGAVLLSMNLKLQ